jgi:hypothetical protein
MKLLKMFVIMTYRFTSFRTEVAVGLSWTWYWALGLRVFLELMNSTVLGLAVWITLRPRYFSPHSFLSFLRVRDHVLEQYGNFEQCINKALRLEAYRPSLISKIVLDPTLSIPKPYIYNYTGQDLYSKFAPSLVFIIQTKS